MQQREKTSPYQAEIDKIACEHAGLRVIYSLSQPTKSGDGLSGRLSVSHVAKIEELHKRQAFVCGPDGFMDNAKKLLIQMGSIPHITTKKRLVWLNLRRGGKAAAVKCQRLPVRR